MTHTSMRLYEILMITQRTYVFKQNNFIYITLFLC